MSIDEKLRQQTFEMLGHQLLKLGRAAPAPSLQAVHEMLSDGSSYYRVKGQEPVSEEQWSPLLDRLGYPMERRLEVEVLCVSREFDGQGVEVGGKLVKRRGGAGGPIFGRAAVVLYQLHPTLDFDAMDALPDGRLREHLPSPEEAARPRPFRDCTELERDVVRRALGSDAAVIEAREPTPSEDPFGLCGVVAARLPDGSEAVLAVGEFGGVTFWLRGAWPMRGRVRAIEPDLAKAVAEFAKREGYDVLDGREDEAGIFFPAVRDDAIVFIRVLADGAFSATPRKPGLPTKLSEEAAEFVRFWSEIGGWLVHDGWLTAEGDLEIVITDADDRDWFIGVAADGVELWRRPATADEYPLELALGL